MRWLLVVLAVAAALVFMAGSAAMNWVFLSSLGKSPLEAQIFGAVSVAVDVLKSLLPIFIASALASKKRTFALIASGVFVLLFGFSLMSAIGFAAHNRGAVTGGKEVIALRYQAALRDVAEVEAKLKAVPAARPQTVVVESLRGAEQDKRWATSKNCTEATAVDSRAFCETYFKTKAELAAALEVVRLDERLAPLKQEVARLQSIGAMEEADIQATLLSRMTGVGVSTAQMALVMFVAVLVEIGAAFGLYLAMGWLPSRDTPRAETRSAPVRTVQDHEPSPASAFQSMPRRRRAVDTTRAVDVSVSDGEVIDPPLRRLRIAAQS